MLSFLNILLTPDYVSCIPAQPPSPLLSIMCGSAQCSRISSTSQFLTLLQSEALTSTLLLQAVIKSRLCSDYHCTSYTWIFFTCSTHDDLAFDCCLLVVLRCCLKCQFLELFQRNKLFSSRSDWSSISKLWRRCAFTATSKSSSFHPWNMSALTKTIYLKQVVRICKNTWLPWSN